MAQNNYSQKFNDAISGDRAAQLANDLGHQKSRLVIQEVVRDYINSTDFDRKVKDIQRENLESTETYKKIEDKVQSQIDKTLADRGLKAKNFWIPVVISVVSLIVTVMSIIVSILLNQPPK